MTGIPVSIARDGKREIVYLSTRRSGEPGRQMQDMKRRYRREQQAAAAALLEVAAIAEQARRANPDATDYAEKLLDLAARQERASEKALDAGERAVDLAAKLVCAALWENHGEDAQGILDELTDADLHSLVSTIETGEAPADFFASRAPASSANSTTPGAAAPGALSSPPDSAAATSKAAPSA